MAEAGGTTTQAGIRYQNSISALYLGRLIDFRDRSNSEQVVRVQIEAKTNVDDTVVSYMDGHKEYFHIKSRLGGSGAVWSNFWTDIISQLDSDNFRSLDKVCLIFGDYSNLHKNLKELTERVVTANTFEEFKDRLTKEQKLLLKKITNSAKLNNEKTLTVLKKVSVEIRPEEALERDYAPLWMPDSKKSLSEIFSNLRDIVGGDAKQRGDFEQSYLLERLKDEYGTIILQPTTWNADNYRDTLISECNICIPAIPTSHISEDSFVWPKAQKFDRKSASDFEDDNAYWFERKSELINLAKFPFTDNKRAIVIAGPGFGKSTLIQILSASLARSVLFPVKIHLKELTGSGDTVLDYCLNSVNRNYSTNIDWRTVFEKGNAVVFLDGLDEIDTISRSSVLEKVNKMSARFPKISWMLTVRDISAVNISTNAQKIELCPLDDGDINQYIKAYQSSLSDEKARKLHDKIKAHKDLRTLSKIPLFLALYLSLQEETGNISGRTDLIEMYLKSLFSPEEFKEFLTDDFDTFSLREIMEKTAFGALEKEEIGLKETDLIQLSSSHTNAKGPHIINACIKRGLLSRTSTIHLEFPFPIIQEYLAANFLVKNEIGSINKRLNLIAKRPWAQTIQFALELHPNPDDISSKILSLEDDAFNTNLRLIGRCISNGMNVSTPIRQSVINRLALIWNSVAWRTQHQIGQVLLDIAEMPISDELLDKLKNPYLLQSEASDILLKINNRQITRDVLTAQLESDLEVWSCFRHLSPSLRILGDEVIDLIHESIRSRIDDKVYCKNITLCLDDLDSNMLSKGKYEKIALDRRMPVSTRLAAFYIGNEPKDTRAYPLIRKAIKSSLWERRSIAKKCIARSNDYELLKEVLLDSKVSDCEKIGLIWNFSHSGKGEKDRISACRRLLEFELKPNLKNNILLIMVRNGDEATLLQLIDNIPSCNDWSLINDIISLLGHFPNKVIGQLIAEKLNERDITASIAPPLIRSITTGLTSVFLMDFPRGGVLEACAPHPATYSFEEILERCLSTKRIKAHKKLDMLLCANHIGIHSYSQHVYDLTVELLSKLSPELEDNDVDYVLSGALIELADTKHFLSLDILEKFALSKLGNVSMRCISMIGRLNSNQAIQSLIKLHNRCSRYSRKLDIKAELEVLAVRFGHRMIEKNGEIVIASR